MTSITKKIALLTYSDEPNLTESDVLLKDALEKKGFQVEATPWDNSEIDWTSFDLLILRSCWNSHLKIQEYRSWLDKIQALQLQLLNPFEIVKWNTSKRYLKDLEKLGVSIVPTEIIIQNEKFDLQTVTKEKNWKTIVIKPAIGASAFGVEKFEDEMLDEATTYVNKILQHSDAVIQPLIPEISQGEISFVFIGGEFTHAVAKIPKPGEYRSNYEYRSHEIKVTVDQEMIEQAKSVLVQLKSDLLYARVDGVVKDGKLLIMELEVIDPHLFFDLEPKAAEMMAEEIERVLG